VIRNVLLLKFLFTLLFIFVVTLRLRTVLTTGLLLALTLFHDLQGLIGIALNGLTTAGDR